MPDADQGLVFKLLPVPRLPSTGSAPASAVLNPQNAIVPPPIRTMAQPVLEDKARIEENAPVPDLGLLSAVSTAAHADTTVRRISWRWGDLGWALLYMAPALVVFAAFTFIPFFRSIWLSFFVTDQTCSPVRFNGVQYYTRVLNLDGSGRDEYLNSIFTTIKFTVLVVPPGIAVAVGLAVLPQALRSALTSPRGRQLSPSRVSLSCVIGAIKRRTRAVK